ncbi:MAG: sigma-70 family RNA polymerase sigma factor [Anaerolineales bacterium]|nr:sigma-70 family RNA polymerase sigma factor [Anaerolineales bacterium]
MPTEQTLIQRWQAGDERAAEALYQQHYRRVFHLAYGLLGDVAEAEEAAQDALAYALINIGRYEPRLSQFSTWLHTITVSRCRDQQRKRRLATLSLSSWLGWGKELAAPAANPERRLVAKEEQNAIWTAVQTLSPPLREAIVLRHWGGATGDGHTYREIADIVGCPIGTAQSRVRLAYQQLSQRLSTSELALLAEENLS